MPQEITIRLPPDTKLGPAMLALNEKQRAFVHALLATGGRSYTEAAIAAGYAADGNKNVAAVTGSRLAHDPRVLEAIHEEAVARLHAGAALATSELVKIAGDSTHPKQVNAITALLDRVGIPARTEHKVTVESEDAKSVMAEIRQLAGQLGVDPAKLIGHNAALDAEFTEVPTVGSIEGLEDLF